MLYRLSRQYSGIHVYIQIHMYTQQQWKRSSRVWKRAKEYMGGLAGKKRENDIISKINKNKKKKACHRPSVWVLTELRFQKPFPPETMRWQEASTADKPDGKCSLSASPPKCPEELSQPHWQVTGKRLWQQLQGQGLSKHTKSSLPPTHLLLKARSEKRKILQAKKYLWHTYIKTKRTVILECFLRVPYRRKRKEPWPLCALNSFLHHPSGCEKGSPGSAGNLGHRTQALRTGM